VKRKAERGQAIVLILIVLAVLAGGYWMLVTSRKNTEQDAERFARDAAQRLVLQQDMRFLNQTLTPHAQMLYPPSWRERFFGFVRDLGPVQSDLNVYGRVAFVSEFFQPTAVFHADFQVATGPAAVELHFSRPGPRWEIDALNLTWSAPPTPTPVPTSAPTPTPTATPKLHRPK
jgi:cbb3-type cytochrome oxidase subunit 3